MRHLGRTVQFEDVAGCVVATDGAPRFQWHAGMPADPELELHHHRRGAKRCLDIAIALLDHGNFGVAAGREFARFSLGVQQDRKFFDLQGDEVGRIFRDIRILGEDRGDRFAHIPHLIGGKHRLPVRLERRNPALAKIDRRNIRNVGRRPYGDDPRQGTCGRRVDRRDPAVSVVGADDAHMELMGKRNVGGETATPPDQGRILQPFDRLSDPFVVAARHRPAAILAAAARTAFTIFS